MRRSIRTLVRVLITTLSIGDIAIGYARGGNPLIHPGNGAGNIIIFVGVVVLFGYWSLAWCNWYSTMTVRELHSSDSTSSRGAALRQGQHGQHGDEGRTLDDMTDGRHIVSPAAGGPRLSAGGT